MTSPSLGSETPRSKWRWLQFSLSTLFVFTLGVAVFFSAYLVGERRVYQAKLQEQLSEERVTRVYDVADLVRMIDPDEYPPTRSSLLPNARKNATITGFGAPSPPERPVARRSGPAPDFDSLIELIVVANEPDMWGDVGGPGQIAPHEGSLTLVICQTRFMHERIESFLQKLRERKAFLEACNRASQKLREERAAGTTDNRSETNP